MKPIKCLNCNTPVDNKFCPNCGQKTDTHRITLKHFLFHDIVHGVWHMEKGILFTLKQALIRPGKASLEYIEGKRIRYYNVFYLILLLTALGIFIDNIYATAFENYVSYIEPIPSSATSDFLTKYVKFFLLLAIPVYALNSFVLFNKKKLLYSEHLIIFGMHFLGIIVITQFQSLIVFTEFVESLSFIADWSNAYITLLLLVYIINGLYGAFGKDYKLYNFIIRIIIYIGVCLLEFRLLSLIIKYYLEHYQV
ncbi:DUF3667 domain-containing protein [Flavobacterium sp. PLA-1-15]|uniref:DUF3667 domain-containing protein n=1 Tax=Flavobacterium sp. PLA-1-15 TaxID=3380533 RepID=UPI003B760F0F